VTRTEFQLRGAATRVALTAGAVERIVELTVRYARERVQFGRPINQFQAAAHRLAQLAGEARVVTGSADAVIAADRFDPIEIAAAKASAGPAASNAVAQAHQLHGAIGITREYPLNFFTRRVWSWRAEYGSSTVWSDRLGATLAASEDLWSVLADG
jgi:acyl-CoA dehydrogenase